MSFQVTEAFVQEFSSNVYVLSQQKGSKLRPFVRQETINGKAKALDRIGAVEAIEKTGRHSNTPQMDTPHSRRWIYLKDYEWADLIDDLDKVRMLNDPTSEYMMAAMWAMGRKQDEVILQAADMVVKTGEDAAGTVSLPLTQQLAASDGTALSNLNVQTLIKVKSRFGVNDVDEGMQVHMAVNQLQLDSLLADNKVTSGDYNVVRALVKGEVDQFMGIQFHRTNKVPKQVGTLAATAATGQVGVGGADVNGYRKAVAWVEDGIVLGVGANVRGRISERDDKSYATQVYASMAIGSTRMEEEKVMVVYCKEV